MKHCPNRSCPHLLRFGRVSEFLDELERCSDCDTPLVAGDAPPPADDAIAYRAWITVYSAADGVQAHLVKGALENADIPVHIAGEALLGAVGELPATLMQVKVQVPPRFAEQARELALQCDSGELSSDNA